MGRRQLVTGFFAREAWLEKNPDAAKAVVRALDKAYAWVIANPKKLSAVIESNTGMKPGLAAKMIPPGPVNIVRVSEMQPFLDNALKYGLIPKAIKACDMLSKYCPSEGC
jgi:ABC-type nitrate/sulfonate/bicarbonate transport system substrate-binding protein